jgi:hypothetical protein
VRRAKQLRRSGFANLNCSLNMAIGSIRQAKPAFDQGRNTQCVFSAGPRFVQINADMGALPKVYAAITMFDGCMARPDANRGAPASIARRFCRRIA